MSVSKLDSIDLHSSCNKTNTNPSGETFSHPNISDDKIRELVEKLNRDFQESEKGNRPGGYSVEIETTPNLRASLKPHGSLRSTEQLTGLPDEENYKKTCIFCPSKITQFFRKFANSTAIISKSKQILIVPNRHYAHWFLTPIEEQVQLLKEAIQLRQNASNVSEPIGLHCGPHGSQSIFHLHVRTGIYVRENEESPEVQTPACDKKPLKTGDKEPLQKTSREKKLSLSFSERLRSVITGISQYLSTFFSWLFRRT